MPIEYDQQMRTTKPAHLFRRLRFCSCLPAATPARARPSRLRWAQQSNITRPAQASARGSWLRLMPCPTAGTSSTPGALRTKCTCRTPRCTTRRCAKERGKLPIPTQCLDRKVLSRIPGTQQGVHLPAACRWCLATRVTPWGRRRSWASARSGRTDHHFVVHRLMGSEAPPLALPAYPDARLTEAKGYICSTFSHPLGEALQPLDLLAEHGWVWPAYLKLLALSLAAQESTDLRKTVQYAARKNSLGLACRVPGQEVDACDGGAPQGDAAA